MPLSARARITESTARILTQREASNVSQTGRAILRLTCFRWMELTVISVGWSDGTRSQLDGFQPVDWLDLFSFAVFRRSMNGPIRQQNPDLNKRVRLRSNPSMQIGDDHTSSGIRVATMASLSWSLTARLGPDIGVPRYALIPAP